MMWVGDWREKNLFPAETQYQFETFGCKAYDGKRYRPIENIEHVGEHCQEAGRRGGTTPMDRK